MSQAFVHADALKTERKKKSTYRLRMSITILGVCFFCKEIKKKVSGSAVASLVSPSHVQLLSCHPFYTITASHRKLWGKIPSLPRRCLTDEHSFSITQLGGTGCFVYLCSSVDVTITCRSGEDLLGKQVRKSVLCVTQRRQCA